MASRAPIEVTIVNRANAIWPSIGDLDREDGAVRLGVLWFRPGETGRERPWQLHTLNGGGAPGESVDFTFGRVPSGAESQPLPPGEYEAWIGMMQEGVSWFYLSGDSVRKLRVVHDPGP